MLCMAGFLTKCICACVCVCLFAKYLKKYEPINFIFGGGLPSDPGRKPFDFEKNRPGVRVGVRGVEIWP